VPPSKEPKLLWMGGNMIEFKYYPSEEVADGLFRIGAIKDKTKSPNGKGFKLALHEKTPDAPLSPLYVDLRIVRSFPKLLDKVATAYMEMQSEEKIKCDLLADVPTAATPIVTIISQARNVAMVTPRGEKTHGSGAAIDGVYAPGQTVLVIDDLITKADSKLAAIKILESKGLVVRDVMVLVDREQGGREQLEAAGYGLHSVFTLSQLLDYYLEKGQMSEDVYNEVKAYFAASK